MPLEYFRNDTLPPWPATITHNGDAPDFSSGWTFRVVITQRDAEEPLLEKTDQDEFTGEADGAVTTEWVDGDLDIAPGTYLVQLKATRAADSLESTIEDRLTVKRRY